MQFSINKPYNMQKLFLVFFVSILVLSGCRTPVREANDRREIFMNYTEWTESVALSYLAASLLEDRLDYEVVMKLTNIDTAFMEVASGEADVFADTWVPYTHLSFMELHKDQFEDLGPNYRKASTGLVVPDYMQAESINDLTDMYRRAIIGIDITSGIMQNTIRAIEAYGLDNELRDLTDAEMSEIVENAIKRREDIVFTGWEPHWLFYRYNLRYLDDPLNVFPEDEQIHTIGRKGFSKDHPRAAVFFERMVLTEDQINELLYEVGLARDPVEGVREWIMKNEFVVNQWVRGLRPEREKIM